MMWWWSLLIVSLSVFASDVTLAQYWLTGIRVVEVNSNYPALAPITKPKSTQQKLFAVLRAASLEEGIQKDCVFYQIPGDKAGELRVTTVGYQESCDPEARIIYRIDEIKELQYSIEGTQVSFWVTMMNSATRVIQVSLLNATQAKSAKLYESSGQRGVFYLAPNTPLAGQPKPLLIGELSDEYPKHPCSFEAGTCQFCRYGVYRINTGEYFCGIDRCGQKNQPACIRGERWQRSREKFSCRADNSHVICSPGLVIDCEGERAICR